MRKRKILFISSQSPCPPMTGGRQRTHQFLKILESLGDVTQYYLWEEHRPSSPAHLANPPLPHRNRFTAIPAKAITIVARITIFALDYVLVNVFRLLPLFDRILNRKIYGQLRCKVEDPNRYDLIVCRYLDVARQVGITSHRNLVIDCDDLGRIDSKTAYNYFSRKIIENIQGATFVSSDESRMAIPKRSAIIPNMPLLSTEKELAPSASNNKNVFIIGEIDNPPLRQGVIDFISNSWDDILSAVPDATLTLAGKGDWTAIERLARRGSSIKCEGEVKRLDEFYERCALVVVPVQLQAGSSVKLLEALAHRRAVVCRRESYQAYRSEFVSGSDLLVAGDAKGLAEACVLLLTDTSRRHRIELAGHQAFSKYRKRYEFRKTALPFFKTCLET